MQAANVPDRMSITAPPFTGVYQKRSGSRRDRTLYCWFNDEDSGGSTYFPHVSLHIDGANELKDFHVTYSVKWSAAFSEEEQRESLSFYYRITEGKVKLEKDNAQDFGRSRQGELLEKVGADSKGALERDTTGFAQAFMDKAVSGAGLPQPVAIDRGPRVHLGKPLNAV